MRYDDQPLGLVGFHELLRSNYRDIPDFSIDVELLVCEPPYVVTRLRFKFTPVAVFLGLAVDGRRLSFAEHAFYRFVDGKIEAIWSIIDKATIEAQLAH